MFWNVILQIDPETMIILKKYVFLNWHLNYDIENWLKIFGPKNLEKLIDNYI